MDEPSTKKRKVCFLYEDVKLSPPLLCRRSHSSVGDTPENLVSKENYASSEPPGSSSSSCSRERCGGCRQRQDHLTRVKLNSTNWNPKEMKETENAPNLAPKKQPSEKEIEEFLTKCEREIFKRFREKYNFDFEKEELMEGRYEWVQI